MNDRWLVFILAVFPEYRRYAAYKLRTPNHLLFLDLKKGRRKKKGKTCTKCLRLLPISHFTYLEGSKRYRKVCNSCFTS